MCVIMYVLETISEQASMSGLLVVNSPPNWGMFFPYVNAIHTIGMKFPIVVVFLNSDLRVVDVKIVSPGMNNLRSDFATHVLEVSVPTYNSSKINVGDELILSYPISKNKDYALRYYSIST